MDNYTGMAGLWRPQPNNATVVEDRDQHKKIMTNPHHEDHRIHDVVLPVHGLSGRTIMRRSSRTTHGPENMIRHNPYLEMVLKSSSASPA